MVCYGFPSASNGWLVFDGDGHGGSPMFPRTLFRERQWLAEEENGSEDDVSLANDTSSDDETIFFDCLQSLSPGSAAFSPQDESQVPLFPSDEEEQSSNPEIHPPEEQLGSFWDEQGRRRSWRLRKKRLVVG